MAEVHPGCLSAMNVAQDLKDVCEPAQLPSHNPSPLRVNELRAQQPGKVKPVKKSSTPELDAIVKCVPDLVDAISGDVGTIGDILYSSYFLSRSENESLRSISQASSKARVIVHAVESTIRVKPSRFHDFIKCLKEVQEFRIKDCTDKVLKCYHDATDDGKARARSSSLPALRTRSTTTELDSQHWFWAFTTKNQAEKLLSGKEDGTFLLRQSRSERRTYYLSINFEESIKHIEILYSNNKYGFSMAKFDSVIELVEHYHFVPLAEGNPQLDWITLTNPLSGYHFTQNDRSRSLWNTPYAPKRSQSLRLKPEQRKKRYGMVFPSVISLKQLAGIHRNRSSSSPLQPLTNNPSRKFASSIFPQH